METNQTFFAYCRTCLSDTEHICLVAIDDGWTEQLDNAALDHSVNTAVLRCKQCRAAQLRVETYTEPPEWASEEFLPPRPVRRFPQWSKELPSVAKDLLHEVYDALAAKQLWLAAMGIRTLIDMFIAFRVGDQGGFKSGLARLKSEGYMGEREIIVLEQALELGHAATHRMRKPAIQECLAALDIAESQLSRLTLAERASLLSERLAATPRVSSRGKRKPGGPPTAGPKTAT